MEYLKGNDWQHSRGFTPAIVAEGGRTVYLSGQSATEDEAGNDISYNFDAQARTNFALINKTLQRAGGDLSNLVYTTVFINDSRLGDSFVAIRKEHFPNGNFPADALITVSAFARPGIVLEIQGIAVIP